MKTSLRSTLRPGWRHLAPAFLACAAALSAPTALADVIDFEQIVSHSSQADSSVYLAGDTFTANGYRAVVADSAYVQSFSDYEPGLAGATVAAGEYTCTRLACPSPTSQYYAGLNDGSLTLSREDASAFRVSALSFGAVAPRDANELLAFGQLRITGTRLDGSTLSAAADFPALYDWSEWTLDAAFAATAFTRITIDACTYTAAGECLNGEDTLNLSQFALDDVHVSAVPEPSTVVLLTAGLLLVAARRLGGRA
jgi:PEP-CTERM motif